MKNNNEINTALKPKRFGMGLDHGLLNLPLHKRCPSDKQIEEMAKKIKSNELEAMQFTKYQKEKIAKPILERFKNIDRVKLRAYGRQNKVKLIDIKVLIEIDAYSNPDRAIKILDMIEGNA